VSGAGLAFGQSEYRIEANAYLQSRLQIAYGFVLGAAAFFYLLDYLSGVYTYGSMAASPWMNARWIHLTGMAGLAVAYYRLRKKPHTAERLAFFDAFVVLGTVATCFGIYATMLQHPGAERLPQIAGLLVVARGIAVPSRARRTLLLSSSAPIALLVIRLLNPVPSDHPMLHLVWDVTVLFLAAALATFASLVNFRLRKEVQSARRLGQYTVEEQLGEGAMGTVHRAKHHMLRRPTAVKVLRPELAGEETVARFEREVQQTALLQHPNTISIYDYGRTPDGLFYYAMELLDGEDLSEILERAGPMRPSRAIHVLRQVCGSLHEAHEKGLVHRDIKLGNIVLCQRAGLYDVAKVLDFGLVKDLRNTAAELTKMGSICGTPETIAPELLAGEPATPRADLYAIGVVAYQLLTGKLPFDAATAAELVGAHLHVDPIPLRERNREVPADLAAVIEGCLAKQPDARPASAAELRTRLGACADAGQWSEADAAAWWQASRP
jgi:serine/threonine-protein kinase